MSPTDIIDVAQGACIIIGGVSGALWDKSARTNRLALSIFIVSAALALWLCFPYTAECYDPDSGRDWHEIGLCLQVRGP